jgi:hypothetical protein
MHPRTSVNLGAKNKKDSHLDISAKLSKGTEKKY